MRAARATGSVLLALLACAGIAAAQAAPDAPAAPDARQLLPAEPALAASAPRVAVGSDGTVAVAFAVEDEIWCAVSRDGGSAFGAAAHVGSAGKLERGVARGPQVAVTDGAIVIAAVCGAELRGKDGNLLAWRSTDRGATWTGPARINDTDDAAREGLAALAAAPDGTLLSIWLDLRHDATELWGSWSSDGGATWDENLALYASPEGSICECCHPALTFDPHDGHAVVLWRNKLDGNRDMYSLAVRRGEPISASAVQVLDREHWTLEACPMAGGGLAVSPGGALLTFWRRGGTLYTSTPEQQETELGEGRETAAAAGPGGFHLVWTDGNGRVQAANGLEGARLRSGRELGKGFNACVAGAPDGHGPVVAVWETGAKGPGNLRVELLARREAESDR